MIKFTAKGNGRQLVGLGITARNVEELRKGRPIIVRLKELNVEGEGIEVSIFYGEDERELYEYLRPFIGPKTDVKTNDLEVLVDKKAPVN